MTLAFGSEFFHFNVWKAVKDCNPERAFKILDHFNKLSRSLVQSCKIEMFFRVKMDFC